MDLVAAHKWLNIAAIKGSERAASLRADLARNMTKADLAAALRAARDWMDHTLNSRTIQKDGAIKRSPIVSTGPLQSRSEHQPYPQTKTVKAARLQRDQKPWTGRNKAGTVFFLSLILAERLENLRQSLSEKIELVIGGQR